MRWSLALLCSVLWLHGCGSSKPGRLDAIPPQTTAVPAGGIYQTLPATITLLAEDGASIHYRWEDGKARRYKAPIQVPRAGGPHRTLHFWALDATGNREPPRREHYVQAPEAPHVEILDLDRTVFGAHETATLRWRSMATDATYELAVTSSGWGAGQRLAQGMVTPAVAHDITITGASLSAGENRLWLRVKNAAGVESATSRLLTLHATAATTRAWPSTGVYGTAQTVALVTERAATIYYTMDGSELTPTATRYTRPLTIERTTTVRFFSVDAYGNREVSRQADFTIQPQAATVALQTFIGPETGNETPLTFTWQSDMDGRYDIVMAHVQDQRTVIVQQGRVWREDAIQTTIDRNFLTPGDWRVQVQVRPLQGHAGSVSFQVRAHYRETFVDTRYRDTEATTASWETTQQRLRLARGPRLLGTYPTRGRSRQVTVHGKHAYVANSRGGLHIVDVSDPHQPQRAGVFYPHGKAKALAKYDHYVYMAASGTGLVVFDVQRPHRPKPVAIVRVPGSATDIAIAAPYAYVGTRQGLLAIFDLTTPRHPRLLSQIDVGGRIVDIAVSAGRLYLACLNQGVVVVDVHTPQRPHLLQRLPTTEAATGVAVHGQQVFVAAGALDVFDMTRPAAPQRTANRRLQQAYGLALLPPYAVVASGSDGLQVVSMDGRGDIAHRPTGHYAARVTLTDTHAVIADTRGGIRLFDLAQPTQPRLVATMEDIGTIVDVIVDGSVAYLADDRSRSGLVVVTISGHGAPYFIGQYHTESTTDVVVWQELAVLSDQAGLLHLVDVQQPSRPRLRDSLALPGKIQRLTLLPPYVLAASDEGGVHVVEVAPTGLLQHQKTLFPTGRALDIVVVDRTAYIAAVDGGIQTMDVSVPGRPTLGTPYHHPDGKGDHILRVVAYQDTLYAIDNQRGIQILRRSGAGALQLLGRATVPRGAPWGLTAVGPYVFVTTLLHSLYVLDMTDPAQPHLLSTAPYGGTAVTAVDRLLYIAVRGYRGVPGGLRVMETFTPVSDHVLRLLQIRGVTPLPGLPPGTQLVNHAYTFHTPAVAASIALSPPDVSVPTVRLHVRDYWGVSGKIRYQLSNDGGIQWHPVQPGTWHRFPEPGTELRWRALLEATNPLHTPVIEMLRIDYPAPEQVPQHTTP